ncbi:hypothetical protein AS850_02845 [Frondihabitans sp. 762G35]|uniref:hypothetical protein n=1 Tax=Frondihabitans sp. 762G35 TaxID=1446794 RepID=UPI000D217DBF|nr:hypothetical protein [Frondihabitans sp. 762G35]ARC56010.1 hypothetical protein AS850_02845 [Frondihabitans sp. 762G35]
MSDSVQATVYLQLEPVHNYLPRDNPQSLIGAKVVGLTQKKAAKPRGGTVEVKLTIQVPKGAFLPLRPEAVIVIPQELTQAHPITVDATDPNESDTDQ